MKKGKEYELLIEKIYNEFGGDAVITQDDFIWGEKSKTKRQIDLSIKAVVAGVNILIIVQAKDWNPKKKVDINDIGSFAYVLEDVRASKGIMICNSGFTKKAKGIANIERIELYSAHEAMHKKWHMELFIPVVRYETVNKFGYGLLYRVTPLETLSLTGGEELFKISGEIQTLSYLFASKMNPFNVFAKDLKIKIPVQDVYSNKYNNEWREVTLLTYDYSYLRTQIYKAQLKPIDFRALKSHSEMPTRYSFINYGDIEELIHDESLWIKIEEVDTIPILKSPHFSITTSNLGIIVNLKINHNDFENSFVSGTLGFHK